MVTTSTEPTTTLPHRPQHNSASAHVVCLLWLAGDKLRQRLRPILSTASERAASGATSTATKLQKRHNMESKLGDPTSDRSGVPAGRSHLNDSDLTRAAADTGHNESGRSELNDPNLNDADIGSSPNESERITQPCIST